MAEQTVVAPKIQTPHTTESTRHHECSVAPPVDIHETREGLVVADVPGVAHEALEVRVDENVRTMRFALPANGDHSWSTADVPCGVCTVHVLTAEEVTPRQSEVSVGEVLAHRGFFESGGGWTSLHH